MIGKVLEVDNEMIEVILDDGINQSRKLAKEKYDLLKKLAGLER